MSGFSFLDLFTVLRELVRLHPDRVPLGEDGDPAREVARVRSHTGFESDRAEVVGVQENVPGRPVEVLVRSLSMFGIYGLLPREMTTWVTRAGRDGDALREFIDAFLHRPISLAFAESERLRPGAMYERTRGAAGWTKRDPYLGAALRTAGLSDLPDATADRLVGVIAPLARYAGTPDALAAAAAAHLGVPVSIIRLPRQRTTGVGFPVFSVRVGPMPWAAYRQFVPQDDATAPDSPLADLLTLTRLHAGLTRFEVTLLLAPGERPPVDDPANGRRWVSAFTLDDGVRPREGVIPAALCELLLSGLATHSES